MQVEASAEQRALRADCRRYLDALITPSLRAATRGNESGGACRDAIRRMGADGWLAPGWPAEFGGRGLDTVAQKIVLEEIIRAEAPFSFVTINTVGPCLMRLGTEAQKHDLLPRMAAGELLFAIGYTEPDAGSDLAALKTRAVADGDDFIVSGQKLFTSGAEGADYIWLAVRTDPDAAPHRGISILMVDTRLPGFSLTPIRTVGDTRTNATYYDQVRVPKSMRVGDLNGGWRLITEQLNHERVGIAAMGYSGPVCVDLVADWARRSGRAGHGPVRLALAEAYALAQAGQVLGDRAAADVRDGRLTPALAAAVKVSGTENLVRIHRLLLEVLGTAGTLREGSPGAILNGRLELEYRRCQANTFGGGNNDVLRNLLATGLGLPRSAA